MTGAMHRHPSTNRSCRTMRSRSESSLKLTGGGATTDSGFVPSHRAPASPATRASCSNLVAPRSLSDLAATKLQAQAPAIDRPRSRFEAWRHRSSSPSPTTESSDPALRPGSGRRQCFRCEASCPSPTACVAASWPAGTSAGSPPLSESWNDRQRPVPVCNNRAVPDAGLDPAVMERFRTGDDDAVRTLYRHYGRLVFTIAVRILGNRQLAEDATQQAFLQAWRAASTFESGKDPAPWLATIARRVAIDMQRREVRRPATSLEECQRRRSCPGHPSPICGGSVGDLAGPRCDRFAATRRARGRTAATHRGPQPERDRAATRSCHRDGEVAVVSRSSAPGDASQISPRTARQWLTY